MSDFSAARVLVVEDEPPQMELLAYNLEKEGFSVSRATDGEEGLLCAEEVIPDIILLDWMLPNLSGIEVCRQLKRKKETSEIPVIMLTARGEETDRVRGLDTGADDYIVKPYSITELMARVRATLRRSRPSTAKQSLSFGELVVDLERHRVSYGDDTIKLGPTEFRLLVFLLEKPGRVWSREQLLDRVWGMNSDIDLRTVDVHVGRLRKALKQTGKKDPVRTIRGFGYSLDDD
jgi:two-component system phosphate regulon response regulator PhoB